MGGFFDDGRRTCKDCGKTFASHRDLRRHRGDSHSTRRKCEECGKNWANSPSRLCPGCDAYRDHTGAV